MHLFLLLMTLTTFNISAVALDLGDIKVQSYLNQPLRVYVPLLDADSLNSDEITASLAPKEEFAKRHLDRHDFFEKITIQVQSDRLLLTTEVPVDEFFLILIVKVQWSGGFFFKELIILLDVLENEKNKEDSFYLKNENTVPFSPPINVKSKTSEPSTESLSLSSIQTDVSYTSSRKKYTIKKGESLWAIASRLRTSTSIGTQQWMLAIMDLNKHVLVGNNIHKTLAGTVIILPIERDALKRSYQEAVQELRAMNASQSIEKIQPNEKENKKKALYKVKDTKEEGIQLVLAQQKEAKEKRIQLALAQQKAAKEERIQLALAQKKAAEEERIQFVLSKQKEDEKEQIRTVSTSKKQTSPHSTPLVAEVGALSSNPVRVDVLNEENKTVFFSLFQKIKKTLTDTYILNNMLLIIFIVALGILFWFRLRAHKEGEGRSSSFNNGSPSVGATPLVKKAQVNESLTKTALEFEKSIGKLSSSGQTSTVKQAVQDEQIDESGVLPGVDLCASKLDLARVYIDMKDDHKATQLLEEVMSQGSLVQKECALDLLNSIK